MKTRSHETHSEPQGDSTGASPAKKDSRGGSVAILSLIVVFSIACIAIVRFPIGWDFRNNLWAPTHLLVNQQSPYNIHVMVESSNAVWMPMVIGIFFPMGFLPLQLANNLWWAINLAALVGIIWIAWDSSKRAPVRLAVTLLLFAVFPPTMTHFMLGQISLLVCLAFLVMIKFGPRLHPFLLGFLLAFSLAKPQLAVFFVPAFMLFYLRERGSRKFWQLLASVGAWMILSCLPLLVLYPQWLPDFLTNLSTNPMWAQPGVFSLLTRNLVQLRPEAAVASYLLGIAVTLYLLARLPTQDALLWSLALTPLFSPYIWSWDFVLLYPIIAKQFSQSRSRLSTSILLVGYLACLLASMRLKLVGRVSDELNWWIPWVLLASVVVSQYGIPLLGKRRL